MAVFPNENEVFLPFLLPWQASAAVEYDRNGDSVTIKKIDMTTIVFGAAELTVPFDVKATTVVDVYSNGSYVRTYSVTDNGSYLYNTTKDKLFGGVTYPNLTVKNPTFRVRASVIGIDTYLTGAQTTERRFPVEYQTFIRAYRGGYVYAQGGGGGFVGTTSPNRSDWERIILVDRDGGDLKSGDAVNLRAWKNRQFFSAADGGGGSVDAVAPWDSGWETAIIVKVGGNTGDAIRIGSDQVGFYMPSKGLYWSATYDRGGQLRATATWFSDWEKFTLIP